MSHPQSYRDVRVRRCGSIIRFEARHDHVAKVLAERARLREQAALFDKLVLGITARCIIPHTGEAA